MSFIMLRFAGEDVATWPVAAIDDLRSTVDWHPR